MSKDKYRPSTADFEVTRTRQPQDTRTTESRTMLPPPTRFAPPVDPNQEPDLGWGDSTPGVPDEEWQPIEDELVEDDWYPHNLRVKSQVIRYNEQGRMRVDVTFEWDELDAADGYFIRIAEAE